MCAEGRSSVQYDHRKNDHSVEGAREALHALFGRDLPPSLLDIGCGTGTWLRAALDAGVADVLGVDGIEVPADLLQVPRAMVRMADLRRPIDVGRRFDLLLCLEVAEHLEPECAETLIDTLVAHSDHILFSAAVPGQAGDHHMNCRWPVYWQQLFNARGFACDDGPRWAIWEKQRIEPWYRQNMMLAVRDPARAGEEPRIRPVIHPDMLGIMLSPALEANDALIEHGSKPARWYLMVPLKAAAAKIRRRAARGRGTLPLAQVQSLPPS